MFTIRVTPACRTSKDGDRTAFFADDFIWKIHLLDIDGDAAPELRFERIDGTGGTGDYLKMNAAEEVLCGPIIGNGEPATWDTSSPAYGVLNGTFYQRGGKLLVNYKRGGRVAGNTNGSVYATSADDTLYPITPSSSKSSTRRSIVGLRRGEPLAVLLGAARSDVARAPPPHTGRAFEPMR